MAQGMRDINIFRVLEKMKGALALIEERNTMMMSEDESEAWKSEQRRFLVEGKDVRVRLVEEFSEFLFSCEWTNSPVVREIVGYIENGTSLNQIGNLVGLKNSAFRQRVQRMTLRVNDLLFDGHTCPEGVYTLTDLGAIKKCLVKIRLVREPIVLNEEFSLRQIGWLKAHIGGVEAVNIEREHLDKYFQSVLYLALTSRTFTLNLLDDIDPMALGYALKDMQADSVNSTKLLFSLLLRRLTSASVACKEELLFAKREYMNYVG